MCPSEPRDRIDGAVRAYAHAHDDQFTRSETVSCCIIDNVVVRAYAHAHDDHYLTRSKLIRRRLDRVDPRIFSFQLHAHALFMSSTSCLSGRSAFPLL